MAAHLVQEGINWLLQAQAPEDAVYRVLTGRPLAEEHPTLPQLEGNGHARLKAKLIADLDG